MKRIEQFIANVRKKPEHIRLRYVLGFTTIGMLVMIMVWLLNFKYTFEGFFEESKENVEKIQSDIEGAKNQVGGSIEDIIESMESQVEKSKESQQEQQAPLQELRPEHTIQDNQKER